ncbi:MAG: hypothetical protein V6014_00190 [Candidatus Dasytiphilus stammeri]
MIISVIISAFGALANQSDVLQQQRLDKINHLHASFTPGYYILAEEH